MSPGRKRYKVELTAAQIGKIYSALNVRAEHFRLIRLPGMGIGYRRVWRSIERQQLKIEERRRMKL